MSKKELMRRHEDLCDALERECPNPPKAERELRKQIRDMIARLQTTPNGPERLSILRKEWRLKLTSSPRLKPRASGARRPHDPTDS